jgi:pimeloyl-ACP methyl ester carboxylesterase
MTAVAAAVLLSAVAVSPAAAAGPEGPPLSPSAESLDNAVHCGPDVETRKTVLLVHGTGSTAAESWSWGYARALTQAGFAVCTVDLPGRSTTSLWDQSDTMVNAVRDVAALSGQKISVVGHSQGGFHPLWAIKYWPDVANDIDDYVGLAPGVRGTELGNILCAPGTCQDIAWQVSVGSKALTALNSGPLPPSVSYTSVYTMTDEVIFPQPEGSRIDGAANISVQSICPGRLVDHALMLADNVAWALALDALAHDGPADAARINRSVCDQPFLPGADMPGFFTGGVSTGTAFTNVLVNGPRVTLEPPLPDYAR